MAIQPRQIEDIYDDVRSELENRITKVTNFVGGSFNNAFLASHSAQMQEVEIKALAGELAGSIDYAGKELNESDLNRLGIENVDPERINEYMHDSQLDRLAGNFNVSRDEGSRATGKVIVESSSQTTIANGMEVGTQPNASGRFERYLVTDDHPDDVDLDDEFTGTIEVEEGENELYAISEDVGQEFNVGPNTITYIPNPRPSIQEVFNPESIDSGEDIESNDSLRERVKSAIFNSVDGGTRLGMTSYIEENASDVVDVNIDEFKDQTPPFVDVVIDGGDDEELEILIDESRPTGIKHNLARPNELRFSIFTSVVGEDIDIDFLRSNISTELANIGLGGSFSSSSLLNTIISSQSEIESVPALNSYIDTVTTESHVFDETVDVYSLDQGPLGRVNNEEHRVIDTKNIYELFYDEVVEDSLTAEVIIDDQRVEIKEGVDFDLISIEDDGVYDAIELTNVDPDIGTTLRVDYNHDSVEIAHVEAADGTVFEQGTDYGLIDDDGDNIPDSIDWSVGGDSPTDAERFDVDYTARRTFEGDKFADDRQLFDPEHIRIDTE